MTAERSPAGGTAGQKPDHVGDDRRHDLTTDPRQFSLDDALEVARSRRDAGAQQAENKVHTAWRLAAENALQRLAASGEPFGADDLRDRVGPPPGHHNSLGSLFLGAARRGEIIAVGLRQSARPEAQGRQQRLWRGTAPHDPGPDSAVTAAERIRRQTAQMQARYLERLEDGDGAA